MATMTLYGIQKYLLPNDDLFADLTLPDGIDKDALTNNILLRSASFESLYTNPEFLKPAISLWGVKHYRTFEKWVKALSIEYEPLENYDRIEEWSDTRTLTATNIGDSSSESSQEMSGGATSATTANATGSSGTSGETENLISAFDSNSYSAHDKQTTSSTGNTTTSDNSSNNTTSFNNVTDASKSSQSSTNTENTNNTQTGRAHGNIGVTTSQQMLESELDIARFNLIEQITDLFIQEFCIMVY